jgi:spore maturation protein CgeB
VKLVIFGCSVASEENEHATFWRGLIKALGRLGHHTVFFEHGSSGRRRDLQEPDSCDLVVYSSFQEVRRQAAKHLTEADAVIVTSHCPDSVEACRQALNSPARVRCFYDLDTGVTLDRLRSGQPVDYIPEGGLGDFDLVLSYTGGQALSELKTRLHARHVAPLYGCVDPEAFQPAPLMESYRADLSYLGSYSARRRAAIEFLFLEPARRRPDLRFVMGGAKDSGEFPRTENISLIAEIPLGEHPTFYSSSRLSLNVTDAALAEAGYCPSAGLFEAAACGVPVLSDEWEGLDYFFEPSREILVARTTGHVMDALSMAPKALANVAKAGRDRVLAMHTANRRALELENILEAAVSLPVEQAEASRE